jgi:hypothetical protein
MEPIPNKYEQLEKQLHQRNKSTIMEDYGKDFIEHIPKYKAFYNVPNHIHYQPVIQNCFNRYYEFEHDPEDGDCTLTLEFPASYLWLRVGGGLHTIIISASAADYTDFVPYPKKSGILSEPEQKKGNRCFKRRRNAI